MTWYRTGTVTVSTGSTVVTGVNTRFAANAKVGDAFRGPDGYLYEIVNIASETVLSVAPAYQGASVGTSADWSIAPIQGYNRESAERLRAITDELADMSGTRLSSIANAVISVNDMLIADTATTMKGIATGDFGRKMLAQSDETGARTLLGLGSAATRTAQTSFTDTTANALMITGAFGIGQNGLPIPVGDLDSPTVATGTYRIDVPTGGFRSLPAGPYAVQVQSLSVGSASVQTATAYNTGRQYRRVNNNIGFDLVASPQDFGVGDFFTAPILTDFSIGTPSGFYRGFGVGLPGATPNGPPGTGDAVLSIIVTRSQTDSEWSNYFVTTASPSPLTFVGSKYGPGAPVWRKVTMSGDWGIGLGTHDSATELTNFAVNLETGMYRGGFGTTANSPPGANPAYGYSCTVSAYVGNARMLFVQSIGSSWIGFYNGTTVTWTSLYSPTNAVGTVNTSGSSAILERGDNATGRWTKFVDGTLHCWMQIGIKFTTSQAVGNIFINPDSIAFNYPVPFVGDLPLVTPIATGTNDVMWGATFGGATLTGYSMRLVSWSAGVQGSPGYFAVGRWK